MQTMMGFRTISTGIPPEVSPETTIKKALIDCQGFFFYAFLASDYKARDRLRIN